MGCTLQELLNRPLHHGHICQIYQLQRQILRSADRPSWGETKRAIGLLKNRKAAHLDGIPAEAMEADIDISTDMLYKWWNREF